MATTTPLASGILSRSPPPPPMGYVLGQNVCWLLSHAASSVHLPTSTVEHASFLHSLLHSTLIPLFSALVMFCNWLLLLLCPLLAAAICCWNNFRHLQQPVRNPPPHPDQGVLFQGPPFEGRQREGLHPPPSFFNSGPPILHE